MDRAAQRQRAGVLGVLVEAQVQRFARQIDVALAVEGGHGGVEHQRVRMHVALAHGELGHRATQLDTLVSRQIELEDLPQVQAGFFHHQLADFPTGDNQSELAIGRGQHGTDGAARSAQVEFAIDLADAVFAQIDRREQPGDLDLARSHHGMGLDRRLATVQRDHGPEAATGQAEIQRIERQHGVAESQAHHQVVQREFLRAADRADLERDVGVHAVPPIGLERQVGQDTCPRRCRGDGRTQHRHSHLPRRCQRAGARPDQRAQVGNVEHPGHQFALQQGPHAPGLNPQRAGDIAGTDTPGEPVVAPLGAAVHQVAAGAVGPRRRQRDAQQRKQLLQVVAGQPELHVERHQPDQAGNGALGLHPGGTNGRVDLEWIRRALVTQGQDRPAASARRQCQASKLAARGECHTAPVRQTLAGHLGPDAGLVGGIVETQQAAVDGEPVDPDRRADILLPLVQQPVAAALAAPLQNHHRLLQADLGQHHIAAQQFRQVDTHLDRVGLHHLGLHGPGRVGKTHLAEGDVWQRPAPANLHITGDHQHPPGLFESGAFDRAAQPVPAQQPHQQHNYCERAGDNAGSPAKRALKGQRHGQIRAVCAPAAAARTSVRSRSGQSAPLCKPGHAASVRQHTQRCPPGDLAHGGLLLCVGRSGPRCTRPPSGTPGRGGYTHHTTATSRAKTV